MTTAQSTNQPSTKRTAMTFEQRLARAIQRAMECRFHCRAIPGRPGYYLVRSQSEPDGRYVVYCPTAEYAECSCEGSRYFCFDAAGNEQRNPCTHGEVSKQSVYRRQLTSQRAGVAQFRRAVS